jgi:hypothetical protein
LLLLGLMPYAASATSSTAQGLPLFFSRIACGILSASSSGLLGYGRLDFFAALVLLLLGFAFLDLAM